ncbi:hypothetical protein Tco_1217235 [Tanacetum coccineum]
MIDIINLESTVTPRPCSEKKRKKKKTQTVTQPQPKSHGPEASRRLPQKRKKSKTQTTSLVQTITKPPSEKVPTEATDTSQSMSSGQTTDPQNTEGNIQPAVKGLPSTLDEGTRSSKPLPKGKPIDAKDTGRNKQPTGMGSPSTHPDDGADTKYHVDQTQSTRFEVSDPDHNKCKTSSEVEPDTDTMILTIVADIQALLGDSKDELKDDSDEEMLEAGEELDEELLQSANEKPIMLILLKPLLKNPFQQNSSLFHLTKINLNPPKTRRLIHHSESSSCSETFKPFDNYMPVTKRVLVRQLRGFLEVLYAQVAEDNWEKHEETVASHADLKWSIDDFHATTFKQYENTDAALRNYEMILDKFRTGHAAMTAQNDHLAKWAESSALMAWSVGPRMTMIENTQANIASLKTNTSEIKAMMTEIFCASKGQSFSTPSSSVPKITLDITGETSRTEGEKDDMITEERVSKTADVEKELVQEPQDTEPIPITIVRPTVTSTETKIIGSSSRPQLIDPIVEVHSSKGGQEFIKIQDADMEKLKKARELKKKRIEQYGWTTTSRRKPETITDILIHPNTKHVAITVYSGNDRRNFEVHIPFRFGDFGITEWDEVNEIILKKKNKVVVELMTSLGKKYDRLKVILEEIEINPSLLTSSFPIIRQKKEGTRVGT